MTLAGHFHHRLLGESNRFGFRAPNIIAGVRKRSHTSDRGNCYDAADPAVVSVNVSPSMTSQPCEAA